MSNFRNLTFSEMVVLARKNGVNDELIEKYIAEKHEENIIKSLRQPKEGLAYCLKNNL